jgi:hypothetical protein
MKGITITVSLNINGVSHSNTGYAVPEVHNEIFNEPVNTLSDDATALEKLIYTPTINSAGVWANRVSYARFIATEITEHLLKQMASEDTKNGYPTVYNRKKQ